MKAGSIPQLLDQFRRQLLVLRLHFDGLDVRRREEYAQFLTQSRHADMLGSVALAINNRPSSLNSIALIDFQNLIHPWRHRLEPPTMSKNTSLGRLRHQFLVGCWQFRKSGCRRAGISPYSRPLERAFHSNRALRFLPPSTCQNWHCRHTPCDDDDARGAMEQVT